MKRLTRNPFHQTDVLKLRCGPETDIVEVHNTDLAAFDRRKLVVNWRRASSKHARNIASPQVCGHGEPIALPPLLKVVHKHDANSASTPALRYRIVMLDVMKGKLMTGLLLSSLAERSCERC
jgi:hypothetical protein